MIKLHKAWRISLYFFMLAAAGFQFYLAVKAEQAGTMDTAIYEMLWAGFFLHFANTVDFPND